MNDAGTQLEAIHDLHALDPWPPSVQCRSKNGAAWPTITACATAASCNGSTTTGRNSAAASSTPDAEGTPIALNLTAPAPPSAPTSTLRRRPRDPLPWLRLTSPSTSTRKLRLTEASRKRSTQVLQTLYPPPLAPIPPLHLIPSLFRLIMFSGPSGAGEMYRSGEWWIVSHPSLPSLLYGRWGWGGIWWMCFKCCSHSHLLSCINLTHWTWCQTQMFPIGCQHGIRIRLIILPLFGANFKRGF